MTSRRQIGILLLQTLLERDYLEDHMKFGYHKSVRKHKCDLSYSPAASYFLV